MEFESAAGFNISVILDSIGILKRRKCYLHSCNLKEFVIVVSNKKHSIIFQTAVGELVQFLSTAIELSVMMFQGFIPHRGKSKIGPQISGSF